MSDVKNRKKVLILLGSPRKNGNSAALAERIAAGAESAEPKPRPFHSGHGHQTLPGLLVSQNPMLRDASHKRRHAGRFPEAAEADAWVIATPVHWFNMSAQTKLWMDRCFALPRYGKNPFKKKIAVAISYGDTDAVASGAVNAIRCFQDSFKYVGADIAGMVYGSALEAGDIRRNEELMAAAEALGRQLAL